MKHVACDHLHRNLHLSDLEHALAHQGDYSVIVTVLPPNEYPGDRLKDTGHRFPLRDNFGADTQSLLPTLVQAAQAVIVELSDPDARVLVHCGAGENRGPAVVVLTALMLTQKAATAADRVVTTNHAIMQLKELKANRKERRAEAWGTLSNPALRRALEAWK